jgi:hypothetical protein
VVWWAGTRIIPQPTCGLDETSGIELPMKIIKLAAISILASWLLMHLIAGVMNHVHVAASVEDIE